MKTSARPPRPIPDRPHGALDLIDGSFALLRTRPKTVAGVAAFFVLPTQLLSSYLDRGVLNRFDIGDFDTETGQFGESTPFSGLGVFDGSSVGTVLGYAILPFVGVALTHMALGWRVGEDRGVGQCLIFTLKKTHIILLALLLSKMIQIVTLLLTTPMVMLVAPVIAAEGSGPMAAVNRAFSLGRRRYGSLLGTLLLVLVVHVLISYATITLPLVGAFLLDDWGWVAFFALGSIGTTILTVFGVGVSVVAYIDVMNQVEGADLHRRLAAASADHG